MGKATILVVEDEALTAKDLQLILKRMGYDVPYISSSGEDAIKKAREISPDLLLMDIMLAGDMDGIEAVRQIHLINKVPVIYLSAYTNKMLSERAKDTNPYGYLSKPFAEHDLRITIEMALYKHSVEKKLDEEKHFSDAAIDAQIDTFFVFDPKTGKAIRWNKRFREISGYTDEEIAGLKAPDSYYSPEDLNTAAAVIHDVLTKGEGKCEISLMCKDGRRVLTEYLASGVKDEENNVKYIISVGRDITERRMTEERLIKAAKEWEVTFDSVSDMVSIHDKDFNLVRVNKAFCDRLGKKKEDIIGKKCYEVIHDVNEPWPECPHKQTMKYMKPVTEEFFETKLGIYLQVSTSPIFDENREITGAVHIAKDITDRKKAE